MTIAEWKEKAFEGGYSQVGFPEVEPNLHIMLLSAEAWKAVGKVEGWKDSVCFGCGDTSERICDCEQRTGEEWLLNMHDMIDALAEGKTIEQYLETL